MLKGLLNLDAYLTKRVKKGINEPPIAHEIGAIAIIPAKIAVDRFAIELEKSLARSSVLTSTLPDEELVEYLRTREGRASLLR